MKYFENLECDSVTIRRKQSALGTMLNMMDVPEMRKNVTSISNVLWLNRNLRINNGDHPMVECAMSLVTWLIKNYNEEG